jgi:hypothetical protein
VLQLKPPGSQYRELGIMCHHNQRLIPCAQHFTQHFQHLYSCFRVKAKVGKSIAGVFDNEAETYLTEKK